MSLHRWQITIPTTSGWFFSLDGYCIIQEFTQNLVTPRGSGTRPCISAIINSWEEWFQFTDWSWNNTITSLRGQLTLPTHLPITQNSHSRLVVRSNIKDSTYRNARIGIIRQQDLRSQQVPVSFTSASSCGPFYGYIICFLIALVTTLGEDPKAIVCMDPDRIPPGRV